jgi:hypothetical protein
VSYTLKLDWDDDRIGVVSRVLTEWLEDYPVPEGMEDYPQGCPEWEAMAALDDIRSYVGAREEAKETVRNCPGCSGEGEDHGG